MIYQIMDIKRLIFFSVLILDGFVERAINDTNFELKQRGFWLFSQLDLNLELLIWMLAYCSL